MFARKDLPRALTSYDLFKCAALLLMLVDHVGFYFFPEDNWWRVFGRMCVPIWFFLVGYARSRDFGPWMWAGAVALTVANFIAGMPFFALNILFTILIVRAMIDAVGTHMVRTRQNFWAVNVLIVMIAVPTMMGVEYGTLGLALALFGYFARRRAEGDPAVTRDMVMRQMGFALFIFCFYQYLIFQPTQVQFVVMAAGVAGVSLLLSFFRPAVFARTGEGALPLLTAPLRFMGRHTLGIYVAHLLLFKALGMWLDPERFPPFTWVWIVF